VVIDGKFCSGHMFLVVFHEGLCLVIGPILFILHILLGLQFIVSWDTTVCPNGMLSPETIMYGISLIPCPPGPPSWMFSLLVLISFDGFPISVSPNKMLPKIGVDVGIGLMFWLETCISSLAATILNFPLPVWSQLGFQLFRIY